MRPISNGLRASNIQIHLAPVLRNLISEPLDQPRTNRSTWWRAGAALVLLVAFFLAVRQLPLAGWLDAITEPIRSLGPWGPVAFAGIYIVATVLLIPGSLMTLAAGGLFGVALGGAVVSVASTLSAGISFLLARYLARNRVQHRIAESPKLAAVDEAIGREGWKIVGLMRLTPVVPFGLLNYVCGVTSIPFWKFLLTSWVAMLPGTLMYVSLGAVGKEAVSEETASFETWALRVLGLVATIAVTVYTSRLAKKALEGKAGLRDGEIEGRRD